MTLCRHNIQLIAHSLVYACKLSTVHLLYVHSTTLTLTLDTLKLKHAIAATVPWKTFTSILDFYGLLLVMNACRMHRWMAE